METIIKDKIIKGDLKIIKTYVFYKDKCFFVSTIERDSSAMYYPHRYNETLVWEYDWDKRDRKNMSILYMGEDLVGSIKRHQLMCEELFKTGEIKDESL